MNRPHSLLRHIPTALFGAFAITAASSVFAQTSAPATPKPAVAPEVKVIDMFDGDWHYTVTPYLWLPNVNSSSKYEEGGRVLETEIGPNDYLSNLKFVLMINGTAHKGDWGMLADFLYINFEGEKTRIKTINGPLGLIKDPINLDTSTGLKGSVWTFAGTYAPVHNAGGYFELLAGFRLLSLDASLSWNLEGNTGGLSKIGSVAKSSSKWDGIVGGKGMMKFGKGRWYMPYYADIGFGSENWTWQAAIGVGYRYNWGTIALVERSLSYTFTKDDTTLRLTGPALTFTWTF